MRVKLHHVITWPIIKSQWILKEVLWIPHIPHLNFDVSIACYSASFNFDVTTATAFWHAHRTEFRIFLMGFLVFQFLVQHCRLSSYIIFLLSNLITLLMNDPKRQIQNDTLDDAMTNKNYISFCKQFCFILSQQNII